MKIKNWKKFQHFKDRRPPWIKLHKEVLEQRDINLISDKCFRVLIGLWLIASDDPELDGNLPDVEDIAFKLRMDKSSIIKCLDGLSQFLIQDDINSISNQYQVVPPEKRREEIETEAKTASIKKPSPYSEDFLTFWKAFNYPKGKAEAWSTWKKSGINADNFNEVISGAKATAKARPTLVARGQTPKMAQGWLSGLRWEDEDVDVDVKVKQSREELINKYGTA